MSRSAKYEFALQEPALALAPVFLALPKRGRAKLDVTGSFGQSQLRWRGADALGIAEQSVFLGLLAIAAQQKLRLDTSNPGKDVGARLMAKLSLEGTSEVTELFVLRATWSEIAVAAGRRSVGGKDRRDVKMAVRRFAETTLWERRENKEYACRILSWLVGDDDSVFIALNPRASTALLGGQYCHISLVERCGISGDSGKALHAWFCANLRPGQTRRYAVDGLQKHVWGNTCSGTTLRNRRSRLVKAIRQIGKLNKWRCEVIEDGMVEIERIGTTRQLS
jgi:hypothetical protein